MTNDVYIRIAGVLLRLKYRFSETAKYMGPFRISGIVPAGESLPVVSVAEQQYRLWEKAGRTIDAYAEFCLSCMPASEALFASSRCIFHAAAVRYKDKAWLIAAGSGVGKTTQCRNLMKLCPGNISIINGDKPALECLPDGSVIVHPSPWTGKEGMHGAKAAPLAGIILLRRGEINAVRPAEEQEAVLGIYRGIFQSFADEQMIRQAAAIAEKILKVAPAWVLTSSTVPDSTKLLLDTMKQGEK